MTPSIGLAIVCRLGLPWSHGVDGAAGAAVGVSSITAWLTQASDKVLPDRFRAVSVTTVGIYDSQLMIDDLASLAAWDNLGLLCFQIINQKS